MCLLQPCWGVGSACWAGGCRDRHRLQGRLVRGAAVGSFQLKAVCAMIDCTASPAIPCMRHSLSWQPFGSVFPPHPPCNEALMKTRELPGCLLRHLGVLSFFCLLFFNSAGCEPQWKDEEGEIKKKAGAIMGSFLSSSSSKSKFHGV